MKYYLICLPFAGGNKYSYRAFNKFLPPHIEAITLEYPGRGGRMKERLLPDADKLVEDLLPAVVKLGSSREYILYGHSLGGLLSYLVVHKLMSKGYQLPRHVFITGTSGPASPSRGEKQRHLLEKNEFIKELKELKGMPDEILENDDLLEYYEPILRADFKASETYRHTQLPKLSVPVSVITGTEEEMAIEEIYRWQDETTELIHFQQMAGGHFFIYDHPEAITNNITQKFLSINKVYQL